MRSNDHRDATIGCRGQNPLNFICTVKREAQHSTLGPVTEYGVEGWGVGLSFFFIACKVDELPLVMFVPRSTTVFFFEPKVKKTIARTQD